MQVLKDKLNAFERIAGSSKTVLNRQSAKKTVLFGWDSEVFKRKPITFDCIYLYKLEKIGASISFSFDRIIGASPWIHPEGLVNGNCS